ncbi:glycosyltransferase [Nonlabens arenilitoris]|uniref:Glycosyltransferase n=1 Tax=Nonlabens arenilitoris TaxID=1217969 RepID=A0A2S7UEI2_9FLAO|nr:glycosyltransferase [Nonlabens arenilitoris]PQJ32834.1 glycosyltransferase [Nonlabens arenilitoris]
MKKKLLIIGHTWPEPQSTAAGTRMLQLIELFKDAGFTVTFASAASRSDYSFQLASVEVEEKAILLNDHSFNEWAQKEQFNAVMYDRFMIEEQFGWRFRESCPNSINILDTEDLHFLRAAREVAFKNNEEVSAKHLHSTQAMREIASIYRCDVTLIISEYEIELLQSQFQIPRELLHYLPFLVGSEALKKLRSGNLKSFQERSHFSTIGNFIHKPNYDAVLYLKTEIWPLIRKQLPQAQMHVYGSYESPKVSQLHNEKQGFLIKGRAVDANEVIENSKVLLAPIRYGAGLKGKLFTAMETGTPFVGTSVATEGIFSKVEPREKVKSNSFDHPADFAQQAVQLYINENLWNQQQELGFQSLHSRFDQKLFYDDFISIINDVMINLEHHRLHNFMGQLLQQQAFNSTKYFSQWIEEKNRR